MKYESPTADDRRIWDLWLTGTYQAAIVVGEDVGTKVEHQPVGAEGQTQPQCHAAQDEQRQPGLEASAAHCRT